MSLSEKLNEKLPLVRLTIKIGEDATFNLGELESYFKGKVANEGYGLITLGMLSN